jgi:hypothetical protein
MITFITTVQLKDAEQNDYDRLDIEMNREAFSPLKQTSKQHRPETKKSALPIYREYRYKGGITLQEATAAAYRASSRVGKKYSFTILKDKA